MLFVRAFMPKIPKAKDTSEKAGKPSEENTMEKTTHESDGSVKAALREILIFIIFLVTMTIVANASQHLYMFFFNQAVERSFMERNIETELGIEMNFYDLATTADWWLFMENIFLTNLHGLNYDWQNVENEKEVTNDGEKQGANGEAQGTEPNDIEQTTADVNEGENNDEYSKNNLSRIFLRDNILLGPPRLRQIRVQEEYCEVHDIFLTYFTNCYGPYTKENENNTNLHQNSKFYTMAELHVMPLRGIITKYYGAGFVTNLSYDLEENQKILENLKANKWIDRGTRLIILEFVLFNINANMFENVKILAEVPPVGGIVPSDQLQALKVHTLWSEGDWFMYVVSGIFYLLVLFYSIEKIFQCKIFGVKLFFSSIWNLLDILVLIFCYLSLVYNLIHPWYVSDIIKRAHTQPQEFLSIDIICFWNLLYINMMAVCVFLVWIKIFKYISFNQTMSQFSMTLKRCAKDLFGFAVMFFIVFLAYAQLGLLIFGASHPDFRKFGVSVISLMRMFLGDFEYQLIEESNRVLGPIFFLTYVIFVFFILLNMFLAIINDTYGVVKGEGHKIQSNFGSYFYRLLQKSYMWCVPKKKHNASSPSSSLHEGYTRPPTSGRLRKRASEVLREYFEELSSDFQQMPALPDGNEDFQGLKKRVILLEEALEQLIINMDRILNKVESKKANNSKRKNLKA